MFFSIKQLCAESDSIQGRLIIEVTVLQFAANDLHCVITKQIITKIVAFDARTQQDRTESLYNYSFPENNHGNNRHETSSSYVNTRITISEQENRVRRQKICENLPPKIDRQLILLHIVIHCKARNKHEFSHGVILTIVRAFRKENEVVNGEND